MTLVTRLYKHLSTRYCKIVHMRHSVDARPFTRCSVDLTSVAVRSQAKKANACSCGALGAWQQTTTTTTSDTYEYTDCTWPPGSRMGTTPWWPQSAKLLVKHVPIMHRTAEVGIHVPNLRLRAKKVRRYSRLVAIRVVVISALVYIQNMPRASWAWKKCRYQRNVVITDVVISNIHCNINSEPMILYIHRKYFTSAMRYAILMELHETVLHAHVQFPARRRLFAAFVLRMRANFVAGVSNAPRSKSTPQVALIACVTKLQALPRTLRTYMETASSYPWHMNLCDLTPKFVLNS